MKHIELYTSSICSRNQGSGSWALILKYNQNLKQLVGGDPMTTVNRIGMTAIIQGLSMIKEPCQVSITTDCKCVIDAINKGWLQNWVNDDFAGRKNDDLWRRLVQLMRVHETDFKWVKVYDNSEYSKKCDKLASDEYEKYKMF